MTDQTSTPSLDTLGQKISSAHDQHHDLDDDTRPLELKPMPGFIKWLPPIFKDMYQQGATLSTDKNQNIQVEGFYANGPMTLVDEDGKLYAVDKNKKRVPIKAFDDLVMLNYEWWLQAQTRSNYVHPERPWLDKFREKNLVQRKVIYVPNEPDGE